MSWDRRTPAQLVSSQRGALRSQVVDAVAPFSPFWRDRFAQLGVRPQDIGTAEALAGLPAVGERDVCPDGDPAGAGALVLQAAEQGWALHAEGPALRRGLVRRILRPSAYHAVVEADTRPTTFVQAGLAMAFPVASTRGDLDVVARAGARLWQVLGLTRADVVVGILPLSPTAALQALQLGALGAGSPAMFPGDDPDEAADALRLLAASVLALESGTAARLLDDLDEAGAPMSGVRTVLLVGAPSATERAEVDEALERAHLAGVTVLGVHVPDGHRLMWGECAQGGPGLHSYPDLEIVQLIDAETGSAAPAGEVVLTQLGLRGTALLRWRTGDVADEVESTPCPGCGRTVPRLIGVNRGALVLDLELRGDRRAVDLRAVAAALAGRADLGDWRIEVGPGRRPGGPDVLFVHVLPGVEAGDLAAMAVAVAKDVRAAAGVLPTQIVLAANSVDLPAAGGPTRRVLLRAGAVGNGRG